MIQRIQTVYLLIAEALMVALFFTKLASFLTLTNEYLILKYNGIFNIVNNVATKDVNAWPLATLLVITALVGFLVIFLYKFRLFQIRLCFFNMALSLGVFVLIAYYIYSVSAVADIKVGYSIVDIFPLVAIVLYYLAYRGIAKDQATVIASSFRTRKK